jgi:hypothetical protein
MVAMDSKFALEKKIVKMIFLGIRLAIDLLRLFCASRHESDSDRANFITPCSILLDCPVVYNKELVVTIIWNLFAKSLYKMK